MAHLIDKQGNLIGTAETDASRIFISTTLSDDGTPANAFEVKVSRSKAAAAKAAQCEYVPHYLASDSGVFVRSDVLRNHETAADRTRRLLKEKATEEDAVRELSVEYTARRKESFAAEIAAGLED